ncbi:MAG: hypothetical protein FWD59_00355 [Micrococcales bacterium]|nr:hypothetical protein [Micrococcales bacterium]
MAFPEQPGPAGRILIAFEGQRIDVAPGEEVSIGRDADLTIDDNPYLHRRLLGVVNEQGFWWIVNVGTRITATVCDAATGTQAWLAPGARLPLIFEDTSVIFTAGALTYRVTIHNREPAWRSLAVTAGATGTTTIGQISFTPTQKQLIVALAEPVLRSEGTGVSQIPSSQEAAGRLGWTMTRFNRKLDAVCAKLERLGVDGLRGGIDGPATNRRARLVEYSVATALVTPVDLLLLEGLPEEGPAREPAAAGAHRTSSTPAQRTLPRRDFGPADPRTVPLNPLGPRPFRESRNPLRRAHPMRPALSQPIRRREQP